MLQTHTASHWPRARPTSRRATAPLALRQTPQTQALSRQDTHAHVSHPRGALCMHMKENSARSARTRAGLRLLNLLKARGRPRYLGAGWVELERASGESCRRGRAIPPRTPVGGPRPRAPTVLPGVADAGSKPHAAARVGRRGGMARCAARGPLAREFGLGRPIHLRCAGWWTATERYAGAEGWRWEGCGRPAERDARDHALGRRRRKRPLADLAAQASGVPAHASWRACVIGTAGRGRVPSEQVVRLTAAAVERPHCSTSHDGGNWAPSRSS